MIGSARVAVAGALATMLCAVSFVPLFAGAGWFVRSLGAIVVVVLIGAVVRRWLQRIPALPLQLVGLLGYVTVLFARPEAVLGVFPGTAALNELLAIAREALFAAVQQEPPVPDRSAIVALTVAGVGLVAVLVDLLAVSLGRAAIAGLPLLVLYIVPVSIMADPNPLLFLPAGAGYVALLLAEGHHRILHLGHRLDTGPIDGAGERTERPGTPARTMLRTARTTGAVALAAAVVVPALLPGVLADGFLNPRDFQRIDGWSAGPRDTVTTIDPMVSLRRDLNNPTNISLLSVRTTNPTPGGQYLTLATLDLFDGEQWTASGESTDDLPDRVPPPDGLADSTPRTDVETEIRVLDAYRSSWLPVPQPATQLDVPGDWRYEGQGRAITGSGTQTTEGIDYTVRSLAIDPTGDQLRAAPAAPTDIAERYTQLPADLPPIVERLARQVTRDAANPYEQALALQEWFLDPRQFRYDTTVKSDQSASALAEFLDDRAGYCQQFAATMAVMARLLDIPARVAVGFTPGTSQADGSYLVGVHDAHAWPELYFAGAGWVRFEPTPTIGGGRAETPAWATPEPTTDPSPDATAPSREPSPTAAPTQEPSPTPSEEETVAPAPVPEDGSAGPRLPPRELGIAALVVLVAGAPMLLRSLVRRRRLTWSDPVRLTHGAWAELRASARDLGYGWPRELTMRQRATRLTVEVELVPASRDALYRVVRAVEMASFAPALRLTGDLIADVRVVRHALAAGASRPARWRALLLPVTLFTYAADFGRRLVLRALERFTQLGRIADAVRARSGLGT